MKTFRFSRGIVPLCALAFLAGCEDDDGTTPEPAFEPTFAQEAVESLRAPFEAAALEEQAGLITFTLKQAGPQGVDEYMGETLVYDNQTFRYVIDPTRPDVPAMTIRFVAYDMDRAANRPRFPLREIGYLDVAFEEQSATTTSLELTLVSTEGAAADTLARYITAVVETEDASGSELTISAAGFAEGEVRVEFDVERAFTFPAGSDVGSYAQRVAFQTEDGGASFEQEMHSDFEIGTFAGVGDGSYIATITNDAETLVLDLALDEDDDLAGDVEHDGEVVLEVTGPFLEPDFALAAGGSAPEATREAMLVLWESVRDLTGLGLTLLGPIDAFVTD